MFKKFLSRQESRIAGALGIPAGDPFGGPAYGEYNDPATAIVGSAVVGGVMGQKSASKQAKASQYATDVTTAEQARQFDITNQMYAPYRAGGQQAFSQLAMSLGMQDPVAAQQYEKNFARQNEIDARIAELQAGSSPNAPAVEYVRDAKGNRTPIFRGQATADVSQELAALQSERQGLDLTRPGPAGQNVLAGYTLPQFQSTTGGLPEYLGSDPYVYEGDVMPRFQSASGELPRFQSDAQIQQFGDRTPELQRFENAPEYQSQGKFDYNLEADPGYRFAVDEAIGATTRQAAGQGKRLSGNVLAEIGTRAGGIASQYADQAFNRQLSQSRENYGRGLTDYQTQYGRERDINQLGNQQSQQQFGMDVTTNELASKNVLSQFGVDQSRYGLDYQRGQDLYGRELGQYGLDYQREQDLYGRDLSQNELNYQRGLTGYQLGYQRNQDLYGRELGQYGLDYQREQDQYGRQQNMLSWLANVAGIGQGATGATAQSGQNMANVIGSTAMANAQNQIGAIGTQYGSMNKAVQGGIGNYLNYQQNNQLMDIYKQNRANPGGYSAYGPYQFGYKF